MCKGYRKYLNEQYEYLICRESNYIFKGDNIPSNSLINTSGKKLEKKDEHRIHSNLIPQPLAGNLEKGKIFICLLNPGFSDSDYDDESIIKDELLNQISQVNASMFWLKEKYKNTGGGKYWRNVFDQKSPKGKSLVINIQNSYCKEGIKLSKEEVFSMLSRIVVDLELFPYHSKRQPKDKDMQIQSVDEMMNYIHDDLIPNSIDREQLICFIRAKDKWRIKNNETDNDNVFLYNPSNKQLKPYMNIDNDLGGTIFNHIRKITKDFTVLL